MNAKEYYDMADTLLDDIADEYQMFASEMNAVLRQLRNVLKKVDNMKRLPDSYFYTDQLVAADDPDLDPNVDFNYTNSLHDEVIEASDQIADLHEFADTLYTMLNKLNLDPFPEELA